MIEIAIATIRRKWKKKNIAHVSCHDIGAKLKGKNKEDKKKEKTRKREWFPKWYL